MTTTNQTQIFKSYSDFLNRPDKTINGVSKDFAKMYPNYQKDNQTNIDCWNCVGCTYCNGCVECRYCKGYGSFKHIRRYREYIQTLQTA